MFQFIEKWQMNNLFRVARLQFLVAGVALYLVGALWARLSGAAFSFTALILGYLVVLPAQLSVHFSNDYFDIGSDQPGRPTLISGGGGVLLNHPELRQPVKWIAVGLVAFSLVMGAVFLWVQALPAWLFGLVLLGNSLGWFYSSPPLRLSQRGLGELCYTLIAGFLVPGLGYLALMRSLDRGGLFFLPPLLVYGLVSILSVEIPDVEDDRLAHKETWLARLGRPGGFTAIGLLLILATVYFFLPLPFLAHPASFDPRAVGLLSLLPLSPGLAGMARRPVDREPATKLATGIVVSLAVFSFLVAGYLFWLAVR